MSFSNTYHSFLYSGAFSQNALLQRLTFSRVVCDLSWNYPSSEIITYLAILKQLKASLGRSSMKKQQPILLKVVTVSTDSIPRRVYLIQRALRQHRAASQYSSALYNAYPSPQQGKALSGFKYGIFYKQFLQLQKELKAQSSFPAERYTPPFENQKQSYKLGDRSVIFFQIWDALSQFSIASAYPPSLCALIAASINGKTFSGTQGGYKIQEMIEGKGSKGILPLQRDDNGFNEQSKSVASFYRQSYEEPIFLVWSFMSKYLNTLGGFYPFFNCCFFTCGFWEFLFLSYFQGGGCWPMVTLGISLNLGAKGGGNYAFTVIYYGKGGSSACKDLSITGILN